MLLCRYHHHAHHRGEFSIGIAADRSFVFRRPDGLVLERHVDPVRLLPGARAAGDRVTLVPRWTGTGERLDRNWAVAVLAHRRERSRRELPLAG